MTVRPLVGMGRLRETDASQASAMTAAWFGGGVMFDHRRWTCDEAELTWSAPSHLIVLTQTGATARTRIACDGKLAFDGVDRPGALSFVPAGVERRGVYRRADLTYSALWIDPNSTCLAGLGAGPLSATINRCDAVVSALIASLQQEIAAGVTPDAIYVEQLAGLAVRRMASLGRSPPALAMRHGVLGKSVLRRIDDHVQDRLGADLTVADLAAIAGMQSDTFARRFKASTGLSPYAFVLQRRVERAEDLLKRRELPLASIAASLGFSGQSHFTTAFRRLRGLTPLAYRLQYSS